MAPPKKKQTVQSEGALVPSSAVQEGEVEVEDTADGVLEVHLESLGVPSGDIAAWRRIQAAVAEAAAQARQAAVNAALPSSSARLTRQTKGKAVQAAEAEEREQLREAERRCAMLQNEIQRRRR